MTDQSSTETSGSQAHLTAEVVKFFLAAARHFKSYLQFQYHSLHTDPFFSSSFDSEVLSSTSLISDFGTAHHLSAWLETAFMTLDGDNRDNLKFMTHFQETLRREEGQDPPIELKLDEYPDILADNMTCMLKPICHFYLKQLQLQRDKLAMGDKTVSQDLETIDASIDRFSAVLASKKFTDVEPFSFSIFK